MTASASAGSNAPINNLALRLVAGAVASSVSRSVWAPTPTTGIRMPKKITKNCGWARKSLHQQISDTAAVTATAATVNVRPDSAIWVGSRPSGKSATAQR